MSDELDSDQDDLTDPHDSEFETSDIDEDASESELIGDWGGGELEAAYLKALSALEASESEMPQPVPNDEPAIDDQTTEMIADQISGNIPGGMVVVSSESTNENSLDPNQIRAELAELAQKSETKTGAAVESDSFPVSLPPTPRQILEACLFVGGTALTSKKLSTVLRGDFDSDFVEREIDTLNRLYAAENRPYEIQLGEGGYRLTLREEFERIRYKVYGLGPKEVRLSQEALEVLAVVAYHQPIKQSRVEELGKPGCGPVLRQLVRRELLAIERDPATPRDVNYKTTPRFLSLFDIRSLDELPRHEQVSYK